MGIGSDLTRIKGAKAALKTAINGKGGTLTTELIDQYPAAVDAIVQTDTSDATAAASDILSPKTAYIADGTKATGTCTYNADTSSADIVANDLLYGKKGYGAAGTEITGTGALWQYVKKAHFTFQSSTLLIGDISMRMPECISCDAAFSNVDLVTSISVWFSNSIATMAYSFNGNIVLNTVTLNTTMANVTSFVSVFQFDPVLHTVNGTPINLSACTNTTSAFQNCTALANIFFAASTIKTGISFVDSPLLSTASLLSIANGLDAAAVGKTLTLHSTSKTNCNNITVDVNAGVATLGTTKSLTDFIQTDKGRTIA